MRRKKLIYIALGIAIFTNVIFLGCSINNEKAANKAETIRPESLDDIPPSIIDNIAPDAEQKIKSEAKEFHVENAEGKPVYFSDYAGKPVVINFWASWSEECIEEMSYFIDAIEKYNGEVEFMMINLTDGQKETMQSAREFLINHDFKISPLFDSHFEAVTAYNVTSLPRTIFIDKDGYIQKSVKGMMTEDYLEELIEKIK